MEDTRDRVEIDVDQILEIWFDWERRVLPDEWVEFEWAEDIVGEIPGEKSQRTVIGVICIWMSALVHVDHTKFLMIY